MLTTAIIATPIALAIFSWRRSLRHGVRNVWSNARRWEKACLVIAFLPIPGPLDEILGAVVIARIVRRSSSS